MIGRGRFNGCEQRASGKWFAEIRHTTGGLSLHTRFRFVMGGYENQRQSRKLLVEFAPQIESGHARKLNVGDHEMCMGMSRIIDKSFGGKIGANHMTSRAQHPAQGLANVFVVVNDGNERRNVCHFASMAEAANEKI